MLFYDVDNERKLDVFVDTFELCHTIPITGGSLSTSTLVPLAELLLTKLQVVELTDKDMLDIVTLLHQHDVGARDDDVINGDFVAALTADDWGLWRTVKLNIDRVNEQVGSLPLDADAKDRVAARANALWERSSRSRSRGSWRLRDRVGDRKRWYELPDEA